MSYRYPLSKLSVNGYKSIQSLDSFELDKLNVLIGANGAGKSNFISLFELLNAISEERLQWYVQKSGGADTLLHYGVKTTKSIIINMLFGLNAYKCKLTASDDGSLFFEEEECLFYGPGYARPYSVIITNNSKESGLNQNSKPVVKTVLDSIKSWKVYHFHDTSDTSPMKQLCNISDNQILRPDASNVAAFLYLLKEKYPKEYRSIVGVVRSVAPFFDDFILVPSQLTPDKIQLEWKHQTSDAYFNAHSLSDGTLRFICLATLLLQPKERLPSTILLDEPELGLHPSAINLLANLLQVVTTKTQTIVSTQSVTLINHLKPENIIVVDRDKEKSVFKKIDQKEMVHWMDDYGLGDLWEKNILGGRP